MRRHLGVEHVRVLLLGVHRRHLHVWLLQHLPLPDGHLLQRDWGLGGLGLRVSGYMGGGCSICGCHCNRSPA